MKNILIVCDVYPPEVSSAANLMKELAEGLKKSGHKITVATSYPKYYLTVETKNKVFETRSFEDGINVLRIGVLPHHKVNFIFRGFAQLFLPFIFLSNIKKYVKDKIDVVIVYSPPLPLALVGAAIKKKYGAKFILNLQDIFPQNAIDLGVIRQKLKIRPLEWLAIKIFEALEKIAYKKADKITFHSEGGRQFLIDKKGVPAGKIFTIPNWIDIEPFKHLTQKISFRNKYGLKGKFIFLFAGIMGPAQGLDFLMEVAREISDLKDVVFLLVGDGMEKEEIKKKIAEYFLKNVILKPFVSKDEYPSLVKDSDVGFICLSDKNKTSFVPGKLIGYMAAARPVVAFLNKQSDGFEIIKKAGCGYAIVVGNMNEAAGIIRKIKGNRKQLKKLGENGFKYVLNNLTIENILPKFEELFK